MDGYTLITGASGFVGLALAKRLAADRRILCLSRGPVDVDAPVVRGEFHSGSDLAGLDDYDITTLVHLAAVTGGSSEEDALAVNVQGTRHLLRHLLDRGCRRFVLASSIAAVGCLRDDFLPLSLPIPDEHPCFAHDAYGLSKSLMEEVTRYFARITPDAEFINLRLGAVVADDAWTPRRVASDAPPLPIPFAVLAHVLLSDVLGAFDAALAAPNRPGVHVYNVVAPDAACDIPVMDLLRAQFGSRLATLDTSWYEQPAHAHAPLYAIDRISRELVSRRNIPCADPIFPFMSETMHALAVTELGKKAEVIELPRPRAGQGEIIVKTWYSGVSIGTEMWIASGKRDDYGAVPFVNGYQATGKVVEVGPGADGFAVGDAVVAFCNGAHAQYVRGLALHSHKLPDPPRAKTAALFVMPAVAANALNHANVNTGDTVLVVGQGLIGQCTAMLARLRGAHVVASDVSPERLAISGKHCADWVIDATRGKVSDALKTRFPDGVDVVLESTGLQALLDDAMLCCRDGGRFVFEGWYPATSPIISRPRTRNSCGRFTRASSGRAPRRRGWSGC